MDFYKDAQDIFSDIMRIAKKADEQRKTYQFGISISDCNKTSKTGLDVSLTYFPDDDKETYPEGDFHFLCTSENYEKDKKELHKDLDKIESMLDGTFKRY